jgi:beta-1,4-mannosyl-glycoprotein beta-1,4-N-acetylglucosaminyltransferase
MIKLMMQENPNEIGGWKRQMIIDSFIFFNELDMLEFRLRMLYPHVDYFIIVESDHTFAGKEKPFYYADNIKRFRWAEDKIINFRSVEGNVMGWEKPPADYDPTHPCWRIEHNQRDQIVEALNRSSKKIHDDALLMMGDVDEIPSLSAILWAKANMRKLPAVCMQKFFYYNLKYLRQERWCGTIFSTVRTARSVGAQGLRDLRGRLPWMQHGGWHLSNFTNVEGIRNKIENFSHRELDKDVFKSEEHIKRCIETGEDLFNRGTKVEKVNSTFFPPYFQEKVKKYKWGI